MYEIQELKLKLKLAHLEMDFEMKKMDFEMKKKDNRNKVLKSIVRKATRVEHLLIALSGLSQAEGTIAQNTKDANNRQNKMKNMQKQVDLMLEGVTPSHHISGGISELYSEVMNETSFCASHCFSRESLAKETCDERGRVAAVSKVFAHSSSAQTTRKKYFFTKAAFKTQLTD